MCSKKIDSEGVLLVSIFQYKRSGETTRPAFRMKSERVRHFELSRTDIEISLIMNMPFWFSDYEAFSVLTSLFFSLSFTPGPFFSYACQQNCAVELPAVSGMDSSCLELISPQQICTDMFVC